VTLRDSFASAAISRCSCVMRCLYTHSRGPELLTQALQRLIQAPDPRKSHDDRSDGIVTVTHCDSACRRVPSFILIRSFIHSFVTVRMIQTITDATWQGDTPKFEPLFVPLVAVLGVDRILERSQQLLAQQRVRLVGRPPKPAGKRVARLISAQSQINWSTFALLLVHLLRNAPGSIERISQWKSQLFAASIETKDSIFFVGTRGST